MHDACEVLARFLTSHVVTLGKLCNCLLLQVSASGLSLTLGDGEYFIRQVAAFQDDNRDVLSQ